MAILLSLSSFTVLFNKGIYILFIYDYVLYVCMSHETENMYNQIYAG